MARASAPSPGRSSTGCRRDAKLIAIDTNADFIDYLRRTSIDDPRLVAVTGSAADVEKILEDRGFAHADYVLSGLPFSTLPPGVGAAIGKATARVIRPGGAFLVYQFSPKVLRLHQAPYFERIDRGFEWINVPPATLFWAWREPKAQPPSNSFGAEVEAARHGIIDRRHQEERQAPI